MNEWSYFFQGLISQPRKICASHKLEMRKEAAQEWRIIMENKNIKNGIEKRRYKRLKADLKLNVSNLFKQNNVNIRNIDSPITVTDISKSGIGFRSKSILPIDFYFNAALKLGSEEDVIYCVIKIIRCQPLDNSDLYAYGCEFVGLAPILNYIFDEYELELGKAEAADAGETTEQTCLLFSIHS